MQSHPPGPETVAAPLSGRARVDRVPRRRKGMMAVAGGGDDGTTGLLGGGRARKDDPRIEAAGAVDEASSAVGLAKALTQDSRVREVCEEVQRGLYKLGAELGTNPELAGNFGLMDETDIAHLEEVSNELEAEVAMLEGFILPGSTPGSGARDLASAPVLRDERSGLVLCEA